jgi:glycerol uptake facilitator-like aquaporin
MREISLTLPEIGMINSTRFIIGTGVGLLIAGKLDGNARKAVGFTLLAVGTLVSIPVAVSFLGKLQGAHSVGPQISERRAA